MALLFDVGALNVAANETIARALADRKTREQLEQALDILLDASLQAKDVTSQNLKDAGFSFEIRDQRQIEQAIENVQRALRLKELEDQQVESGSESDAPGPVVVDFSRRLLSG